MATSRSYAEMLVESLVPAMDIIASERIESINFDKTIKCRIIDTSKSDFGEYKVTDGASTFKAYSEDTTYKKNELVYVTIPMNDFNNQKIIMGKVLDEENEDSRFYKDPLDSFLDITGNLLDDEAITGIERSNLSVIQANEVDNNQNPVQQKRIWAIQDYNFEGYELLALSGYFDTCMGQALQIKSGNYGLRLDIEVENRGMYETKTEFHPLFLDVKHEFFGNPYNTAGPTYQSALFNISNYSNIRSMSLWLIQDGDFKISESEYYIPNSDIDGDEIYLKNPSVRLGYDINKFTEDTAFLFCPNKATYASYLTEDRKNLLIEAYKETHPDYLTTGLDAYTEFQNSVIINSDTQDELLKALNKKKILLRFIYFKEDGKPKGIFNLEDENCPEGTIVHWYRYKLAEDVSDPLAGPYWIEEESLKNSFVWDNFYPNKELEFEQIKVIIEYPGKELVAKNIYYHYDDFFEIEDDNGNIVDVLKELNHENSWINSALTQYIEINKQKASENAIKSLQDIKLENYDSYAAYEADLIRLQQELADNLTNELNALEDINRLPVAQKEEVLYGNFDDNPLLSGESYSDWLDRCINRLEDQLLDYTNKTKDPVWLDAATQKILSEYKQEIHTAASAAGISDEEFEFSAAANEIRDKYKKKIKNIVFDIETEIGKRRQVLDKIEQELLKIHRVSSNIIKFTNQDDVINKYNLQLVKGLTLEIDTSGYQGVYRCYDDLGYIMNKSDASTRRVITANWTNVITGSDDDNKIEEIRWKFPTDNSMIQYPTEGYEYDFYIPVAIKNEIIFRELKMQGLYTRSRNSTTGAYEYNPVLKINTVDWNENIQYYQQSNAKIIKPSKPGDFFTIIREGTEFQNSEPGSEEPSTSGQIFRIKEYYDQNATNNTIYCEVVRKSGKEVYSAQADLIFGPVGTNGTDYTFYLEVVGNDDPAILTMDERNPASQIKIIPHLYDYENKDLFSADNPSLRRIYANKLVYRWFSPTSTSSWLLGNPNDDGEIPHDNNDGSLILQIDPNKTIEDYMYYILAAEIKDLAVTRKNTVTHTGQDSDVSTATLTLNTFLPIPIRSTSTYKTVDGAFKVYYNAQGVSPEYYKDPYRIKVRSGVDNPPPRLIDFKEANLKWEISLGKDTMFTSTLGSIKNFYPVMAVDDNTNDYKLIPPSYYLQDNGVEICINCRLGNEIIWTQPLYICQNAYNSGLLNSWNGKLTIDENNGTILSTMVGAGKKDYKNRFEGVLMGDISAADDSIPTLGLYGYHEGVQSFGLMVDGTAFIGKSGRGQIKMDGNNSSIQSMSYFIGGENSSSRGMKIDLDDGYIDMRGGTYTSLVYTSDFETFDESCLPSSEYHKIGSKVTLGLIAALKYYKAQIEKDKTSVQQKINSRHGWYQSIYNERDKKIYIEKYNKILADITKVIGADGTGGAFAEKVKDPISYIEKLKYPDDPSRIKYLQDNGLDYLLNNQYFSMGYEEAVKGKQARVQISVDDPYFKIISNNQVPIINIGMKEYFLQTDDFISDLQAKNKALVEYKRSHGFPNYTYPPEGEAATIEDIYRQGSSAAEDTLDDAFGQGFKITLKDEDPNIPGGIEGYNFRLIGINNGSISDYEYLKGSFFELNSSGNPFFRVHVRISGNNTSSSNSSNSKGNAFITKYNNYLSADEQEKNRHDKDILLIDSHNYLLQSLNYFDPKWELDDFIKMHETGGINSKQAGHGTKLDLTDGSLIGHNFELIAIQNDEDETYKEYAGSYVMLNSNGSPYFRIWHQYTPTGASAVQKKLQLLEISLNDFLIHSINWKEMKRVSVKNDNGEITDSYIVPGAGIEMDLNGSYSRGDSIGKTASLITAYGFKLEAFNVPGYDEDSTRIEEKDYFGKRISINSMATGAITGSNCYIGKIEADNIFDLSGLGNSHDFSIINSDYFYQIPDYHQDRDTGKYYITRTIPDDPLIIGSMFSVSWDGQLSCYYIKATGGGQIGPFKFTPHALFTNNGVLGQLNWTDFQGDQDTGTIESNSSLYGIYLGIDGFSVGGSKFIIYNLPINRSSHGDKNGEVNDINVYGNHKDNLLESADYGLTKKFLFNTDFVENGYYPSDKASYIETGNLKYRYPYDLTYVTTNNTRFKPRDITMYVRGNSLLDGITHINGSAYVMGTFQVGNLNDIENSGSSNQTWENVHNYAILYANTRVYGVFQTTGKTYLGDAKNNWASDHQSLKKLYKDDGNHNSDEASNFGCIIYRNTYITGTFHVGGSEVYFGCTNEENVLHRRDRIAQDGHFESYILNHYLHGDLFVSRQFVAGLDAAEAAAEGVGDEANSSAIYSKNISLGRLGKAPSDSDQSNLYIYANIQQYGNLITSAEYDGKIELYTYKYYEELGEYKRAYIKLHDGKLELQSSGSGSITITDDGVTLTGAYESSLSIGSDGLAISVSGGTSTFTLNKDSFYVGAGNSSITLNQNTFSIAVGGDGPNFTLNYDGLTVTGGNSNFSVTNNGFSLSSGSATISAQSNGSMHFSGNISMDQSSGYEMIINGDLRIHGDIYANNLHASGWSGDESKWSLGDIGSSGLEIGAGAGWIAGWEITELSLEDDSHVIGLDPVNAKIWFGADKSDYVDGGGKGAGDYHGIFIHSQNLVSITADKLDENTGGEIDLNFLGGQVLFTKTISTAVDIKIGGKIHLGQGDDIPLAGHIDSKYYLNAHGEASFSKINMGGDTTGIEINANDIQNVTTIKSIAGDDEEQLTLEADKINFNNIASIYRKDGVFAGLDLSFNSLKIGGDIHLTSNDSISGRSIDSTSSSDYGITSSGTAHFDKLILNSNLQLNGDATIDAQGHSLTLNGSTIYFKRANTKYMEFNTEGYNEYIKIYKPLRGDDDLQIYYKGSYKTLGALAFEDDIKKKFNINNWTGTVSGIEVKAYSTFTNSQIYNTDAYGTYYSDWKEITNNVSFNYEGTDGTYSRGWSGQTPYLYIAYQTDPEGHITDGPVLCCYMYTGSGSLAFVSIDSVYMENGEWKTNVYWPDTGLQGWNHHLYKGYLSYSGTVTGNDASYSGSITKAVYCYAKINSLERVALDNSESDAGPDKYYKTISTSVDYSINGITNQQTFGPGTEDPLVLDKTDFPNVNITDTYNPNYGAEKLVVGITGK